MAKKELYRIKKGKAKCKIAEIPFDFGLIFEEEGVLSVDFYSLESISYLDPKVLELFNEWFNIECITIENEKLEITNLRMNRSVFANSEIMMTCYGQLIHYENNFDLFKNESNNENAKEEDGIYFLELEGLKIQHTHITETESYRNHSKLLNINAKPDYTPVHWYENFSSYDLTFYPSQKNENIIVEFESKSNCKLTYTKFLELKPDFLALISFLNGANVTIRREYTGTYYLVGSSISSQKTIRYSYKTINNITFNNYIPIRSGISSRTENVLNKGFSSCFDKFKEWNKKLELNSIIFYLNNVTQAISIQEKFFIQIIAFEKLTTLYAELKGDSEKFHPLQEDFEPIRDSFLKILEDNKLIFGNSYNNVRSKIYNLNALRRTSSTEKMNDIINDAKITIDDDIRELIEEVRHKAIHKGDIGNKGYAHTSLLNELIHEIILRMIRYPGVRERELLFDKIEGKTTEFFSDKDVQNH